MNELSQPYPRTDVAPVSWFQFATRHRASIASLVVLVFPLVMPFTALAVNILIYGLYALGFNLVYGYLGLLSFGHAALFGTGADRCAGDPHPRHLLRDGDHGAVAVRVLPVLSGRRLDRRRERSAQNQCP